MRLNRNSIYARWLSLPSSLEVIGRDGTLNHVYTVDLSFMLPLFNRERFVVLDRRVDDLHSMIAPMRVSNLDRRLFVRDELIRY